MSGILTCKQGIFSEMCATTVLTCVCVCTYGMDAGWALHVTELDMERCGFICPPQPRRIFQRKAWALASRFFWKSRSLQLAMISSSKRSLDSAGAKAHFNTCSLHRLTKSSSDSWGLWPSASVEQSWNCLQAQAVLWTSLGLSLVSAVLQAGPNELKRLAPSSPTWRRKWTVCSASGIFFAVKYSCSLWEKSWKHSAWFSMNQSILGAWSILHKFL